jgi:hypothetical protein
MVDLDTLCPKCERIQVISDAIQTVQSHTGLKLTTIEGAMVRDLAVEALERSRRLGNTCGYMTFAPAVEAAALFLQREYDVEENTGSDLMKLGLKRWDLREKAGYDVVGERFRIMQDGKHSW